MGMMLEEKIIMSEFLNRHSGLNGVFVVGINRNAYTVPAGGQLPITDNELDRLYGTTKLHIENLLKVRNSKAALESAYSSILDSKSIGHAELRLKGLRQDMKPLEEPCSEASIAGATIDEAVETSEDDLREIARRIRDYGSKVVMSAIHEKEAGEEVRKEMDFMDEKESDDGPQAGTPFSDVREQT